MVRRVRSDMGDAARISAVSWAPAPSMLGAGGCTSVMICRKPAGDRSPRNVTTLPDTCGFQVRKSSTNTPRLAMTSCQIGNATGASGPASSPNSAFSSA